MKKLSAVLVLALFILCQPTLAQSLSQKAAVALAENFIVQNGYANATPERIKRRLDFESIERAESRKDMLRRRYNTLLPKAIGAKKGQKGDDHGWSIAFDYAPSVRSERDLCRVVTMDSDGSNIRVQHVDGFRHYFAGFN